MSVDVMSVGVMSVDVIKEKLDKIQFFTFTFT